MPISAHGFMNLSCELCGCDQHPGTWAINLGRVLAVGTAVVLTVRHRRVAAPTDSGTEA